MTETNIKRAHLLIDGRVQGVGYRYSASVEGQYGGLAGWVRNLPDGRVELVAEGPEAAVQRLIEWCRHGPRHALVRHVQVTWESPGDEPAGFRIR